MKNRVGRRKIAFLCTASIVIYYRFMFLKDWPPITHCKSVTRFGEISPLRQNVWQRFQSLYSIGTIFNLFWLIFMKFDKFQLL